MNWDERGLVLPRGMLVFLCCLPLACSSSDTGVELYPVRGEVFFMGQPASGAVIHFHRLENEEASPAFPTVHDDGSFELSTFATNDGAETGDYVVTINWREERKDDDGETIIGPNRVGERYSKPKTSTLKAKVTAGDNVLERFDLKE